MIMRYLISTICMALLLWGCDSTTEVPAKPKLVRKKIVTPIDNTAKVSTSKTVRTAKKAPTAQPQNKQIIAKVDRNKPLAQKQPPARTAADSRQVIVKKVPANRSLKSESKSVIRNEPLAQKQPPAKTAADSRLLIAQKLPANQTSDSESKSVIRNEPLAQKQPPAKTAADSRLVIGKKMAANRPSNSEPRPAMQKKPVIGPKNVAGNSQVAQKQPPAKTAADSRLVMGKKMATNATPNSESEPVMQKKPAISPKSEITKIQTAAKKYIRPSGGESAAGDKLIASNSAVTQDMLSASIPAIYDPTGKIDPFEPLYREKPSAVKKMRRKKRVPRTPLERIDLAQLKLVGIILAGSGNRAMVEEASGKGYVIKKGTYIGTNAGKVVKIQKEIVTVAEEFEDVFGKVKTRNRELKLPKPPGEF